MAQLEAERDEARRQLEEEHRLHMAARYQAAVALSLEHQQQIHQPVHDLHDHSHNQHSPCEHSHDHSGENDFFFWLTACEYNSVGVLLILYKVDLLVFEVIYILYT